MSSAEAGPSRSRSGSGSASAASSRAAQEARLSAQFPGRAEAVSTLLDVLCTPHTPLPASLHLHAASPARAGELLASLLSDSSLTVSHLDPLLQPTAPLLFARLLSDLAPASPARPEGLDALIAALTPALAASGEASGEERRALVVLHNAERMRDVWDESVGEALWGLAELLHAPGRLCLLSLSHLPVAAFRTPRGAGAVLGPGAPIVLRLPALRRDEAVALLLLDAPALLPPRDARAARVSAHDWRSLHAAYAALAYDTLGADARDEGELRLLAAATWHAFVTPVLTGEMAVSAIPALLSRAAPLLRDVLARLLPRLVSAHAWVSAAVQWAESTSQAALDAAAAIEAEEALSQTTPHTPAKRSRRAQLPASRLAQASLDVGVPPLAPAVPLLGAYLLLSSFLCSFNPARLDARYFLRDEHVLLPSAERADASARKRKKGGAYRKKPAKRPPKDDGAREDLNRQQLLGPKPFPVERLLAVLQALLIEAGGDATALVLGAAAARRRGKLDEEEETEMWERKARGAGVMSLINQLVAQRQLVRMGAAGALLAPNAQLRCNIGYEEATSLARRVGFGLEEWLWDWSGGGGG